MYYENILRRERIKRTREQYRELKELREENLKLKKALRNVLYTLKRIQIEEDPRIC